METIRKTLFIILLCSVLLVTNVPLSGGQTKKGVVTKPLKLQHGAFVFQICPPEGYAAITQDSPSGVIFAWRGQERIDGTAPSVMVNLVAFPYKNEPVPSAEQILERMLSGIKKRRAHWCQTEPQRVVINGRAFVRATWSGEEPQRQVRMSGFQYVAVHNQIILVLSSQDIDPHSKDSLSLAEQAILTLKF